MSNQAVGEKANHQLIVLEPGFRNTVLVLQHAIFIGKEFIFEEHVFFKLNWVSPLAVKIRTGLECIVILGFGYLSCFKACAADSEVRAAPVEEKPSLSLVPWVKQSQAQAAEERQHSLQI